MPLEAPVMTATFPIMIAVSLCDSGLVGLAHLRLRRDGGPHRDHGRCATGAADPNGPADDAGHDRHPRPRPGPPPRNPDSLRQRPGIRPLLRFGFRSDGAFGVAPG